MRAMLLSTLVALSACGEDPKSTDETGDTNEPTGDTLTCDFLASADNCIESTLVASMVCAPTEEIGVLSADFSTCTFSTGTVITFDPALPLTGEWTEYHFHITVTNGEGGVCAEFSEADDFWQLTVGADTVRTDYGDMTEIDLTCPDGSTYHADSGFSLMTCDESLTRTGLPGMMHSYSNTGMVFELVGHSGSGALTFNCELPQE